jgi:hypothetical protein
MKPSKKPREQIAREMSQVLGMIGPPGRVVTPTMLADFTRNGTKKRQVRFPAAWVPAFCEVVGDDSLRHEFMGDQLNRRCEVGRQVLSSRDMWEALAPVLAERWRQLFLAERRRARKMKRPRKVKGPQRA